MMISKLSFLFPQQINSQGQKATFKNRSSKYLVCLMFLWTLPKLGIVISCYLSALFEIHSKEFRAKMALVSVGWSKVT